MLLQSGKDGIKRWTGVGISREAALNQLRHIRRAVPFIVETDLCVCLCVREGGWGGRGGHNMLCIPVLPELSVEGSSGRRRSLHKEFCSGKAPIA